MEDFREEEEEEVVEEVEEEGAMRVTPSKRVNAQEDLVADFPMMVEEEEEVRILCGRI